MSDNPDSFVSFADYLGLNDEAGQSMLKKTVGDYKGQSLDQIQQLSDQNYAQAGQLGKGNTFDATQKGVATGLASYGDFLKGMSDPASRQALMEKTYGKGSVSWLDSALTGASGGGALGAEQAKLNGLRTSTGLQGMRADAQRGAEKGLQGQYATNAAAGVAQRQAEVDRQNKEKRDKASAMAGQTWEDSQNGITRRGIWYDQHGQRQDDTLENATQRNAHNWATNNVGMIGGNDAAGRAARAAARKSATSTSGYGNWATELQRRQDDAAKHDARPFNMMDPSSWG